MLFHHSDTGRTRIPAPMPRHSLARQLQHYLFYGWLFRDADSGTSLERAAALRHNSSRSRWLLVYMRRWAVIGALLMAAEWLAERWTGDSAWSAGLALGIVYVVMYQLITGICWAFLSAKRQGHR